MNQKLTPEIIAQMRVDYNAGMLPIKEMMHKYNVGWNTVLRNCRINGAFRKTKGRRWDKQLAKKIIAQRLKGISQKEVASLYGVHQSTVSNICSGRTHKDLFQGKRDVYNDEIIFMKE